MIWKRLCMFSILILTASTLYQADGSHNLEKRQIGVLARAGELPQGKRSALVLNGFDELPKQKYANGKDINDYYSLIQELKGAETLIKLGFLALSDKMLDEEESERQTNGDVNKRSVAALARNGELPQKRILEGMTRSGYLIKPPQESVRTPSDLLYSEDFLVGAQSAFGFSPKSDAGVGKDFFLKNNKRTLGSAKTFLVVEKKNRDSEKNFNKESNWGDGYDSEFRTEDKKDVGSSKTLSKRVIPVSLLTQSGNSVFLGNLENNTNKSMYSSNKKNKRQVYLEKLRKEYTMPFFQDVKEPIYKEFSTQLDDEENAIEKRFLGRIPQLGRVHQKAQSPSARRRPHLRPNWL